MSGTSKKPRILTISCSLNPDSRSAILAGEASRLLQAQGLEAGLLDLRTVLLPMCDGDASYSHPEVKAIKKQIAQTDAIILAAPVYNFDLSASAKNLVELTGSAWEDKVVGILCAAGGRNGYMSPLGLVNSLMLDFRCHIVPRFVYADEDDFDGNVLVSEKVKKRVLELVNATVRLAKGLALTA